MFLTAVNATKIYSNPFGGLQFGKKNNNTTIDPEQYAKPAHNNGDHFMKLFGAQVKGLENKTWWFVHREVGNKAVQIVPIVKDEHGQHHVLLMMVKRPAQGGQISIELPAGICDGDPKESPIETATRELAEETGLTPIHQELLSDHLFSLCPSMTTERDAFALVVANNTRGAKNLSECEKVIHQGELKLPLATFLDTTKFKAWVKQMEQQGHVIGLNIIAARGLLPTTLKNGQKLSQLA